MWKYEYCCAVTVGDCSLQHIFRIAEVEHGYLGADLLKNLNDVVDLKLLTLTFDGGSSVVHEKYIKAIKSGFGGALGDASIEGEVVNWCDDFIRISAMNVGVIGSEIQNGSPFDDLIHCSDLLFDGKTGLTSLIQHCIDTANAKPVRGRQSRIPVAWMDGARTK